jgi:predicted MFS family arabinose efflux permease
VLDLLRRNRDFRALFAAQIVSYLGDWFATVALIGVLLDATGSDLAASLVFVAATLPTFLMTPVAGAAVDRFDRRKLMLGVSATQAVVALGFLLMDRNSTWIGLAVQAAVAALASFIGPATQSAVPNVVDKEDLETATLLMSSTWGAMLAVGAALGGGFAAIFGRRAAFVADAASFAVAGSLLLAVRRPMQEHAGGDDRPRMRPLKDTVEAIRYARHHGEVLALLGSKAGFGLAGGVVGLIAVFATDKFHSGDSGTGILLGLRGVGIVAGPFIARRFVRSTVPSILVGCGVAGVCYGLGYALLPLAPTLAVAAVVLLFANLGGGTQWMLSTYGLQLCTPDYVRGRIFAADFAVVTLMLSISFFGAGAASDRLGPSAVTWTLAGVAVTWGLLYLALTRRFRAPAPTVAS